VTAQRCAKRHLRFSDVVHDSTVIAWLRLALLPANRVIS